MNVVLFEPEIPQNTGSIGRTCMATGSRLHLIEPLGFRIDDKSLKRAGMDYWKELDVTRYLTFGEFLELNFPLPMQDKRRLYLATTKAEQTYVDVSYGADDYIMFGKESAGIPEEILVAYKKDCVRIPMLGDTRSLNLANAVAVVLYEGLRQQGFAGLKEQGQLHRLAWND